MVAGPLPPDVQACDGTADRLARDRDLVMIVQVSHQQGCGPDRLVVTERTRVGIDDRGDPEVDTTVRRTRSARAWGVGQSLPQVTLVAVVGPLPPVIDRPAAYAQRLSDLLDRLARVEPEQRLGAASLPRDGVVGGQEFQVRTLPAGEYERSHRSTCNKALESDGCN